MRGMTVGALLLALGLAAGGCRYQNMNAMGRVSPAPYEDLQCFEPGNDEGFSFAIPGCSCNPRLRYHASEDEDGFLDIRFEYQSDSLRMISESMESVDEIYVAGRRLPPYNECDAADKEHWDRGIEIFTSMWDNYQPVIEDLFTVCTEDRIDEEDYEMLEL
ncbi:hypothetical protein KY359_00600 [Candidatus Woesearchaeota archaeon]|nr:hypothetical protein [Candidatus Woesearchaeota archaeon]